MRKFWIVALIAPALAGVRAAQFYRRHPQG